MHKGPLDSPVNTFNIERESEDAEEIGSIHKRLLNTSDSLSYNANSPPPTHTLWAGKDNTWETSENSKYHEHTFSNLQSLLKTQQKSTFRIVFYLRSLRGSKDFRHKYENQFLLHMFKVSKNNEIEGFCESLAPNDHKVMDGSPSSSKGVQHTVS